MKDNSNNNKNGISRRSILPILGGGLLLPLLGFGNSNQKKITETDHDEYKILLRKDGSTVKVKASTLNSIKPVKKSISNNTLYNWLKNKF